MRAPAPRYVEVVVRVIAEERYSWDRIAKRLAEIYEALVESRSAVAA